MVGWALEENERLKTNVGVIPRMIAQRCNTSMHFRNIRLVARRSTLSQAGGKLFPCDRKLSRACFRREEMFYRREEIFIHASVGGGSAF